MPILCGIIIVGICRILIGVAIFIPFCVIIYTPQIRNSSFTAGFNVHSRGKRSPSIRK